MRRRDYLLYGTAIFFSAFLLFSIQPMATKHLLPAFGGSSSVWATSLLFFTGMLFAGYTYVYCLTSLGQRLQIRVHAAILAFSVLAIVGLLATNYAGYVSLDAIMRLSSEPVLGILSVLAVSIGVPYLILSTTGPLFQYWYGTLRGTEPYSLYAISNAGSFLALAAYPFVVEQFLPLPTQEISWMGAYLVYIVLSTVVLYSASRIEKAVPSSQSQKSRVRWCNAAIWVGFAALPSFLLVSTTTVITQTIAPIPLLWVVPLSLYLITFICAFAGFGRSPLIPLITLIAAIAASRYTPASVNEAVPQTASYLAVLFFSGLFCHSELYRLRPPAANLPLFYLLLSLGGMLGVFLASIVPPLLFDDFIEFPIGLLIVTLLVIWRIPSSLFPRIMSDSSILFTRIICLVVAAIFGVSLLQTENAPGTVASRNFYGTAKVVFSGDVTMLFHGSTPHGFQPVDPKRAHEPTAYYVAESGVGRAIRFEQQLHKDAGIRVGVIGLGTGSIAGHCRTNDAYVFYEIDTRIEEIARTHFTYLSFCNNSDVRIGDGRLQLERELSSRGSAQYDVLVADAFTDDSIPVHLLTLEAVRTYRAHLRSPQGIIAIHTSNRYLELPPVIIRIANELGLNWKVVTTTINPDTYTSTSEWVLLAEDARVLESDLFVDATPWQAPENKSPLWTDLYTSLFSVIDLSP